MTIIKVYDVVEKTPEKKFRLYVDSDWINECATLEEAEKKMDEWIDNEGSDSTPDGLEWCFDEICICEVVRMKTLEEIKC